jgi:hypothetical protein
LIGDRWRIIAKAAADLAKIGGQADAQVELRCKSGAISH